MILNRIQFSKNGKIGKIEYSTYYSRKEDDYVSHIYYNDDYKCIVGLYHKGDYINEIIITYNKYNYEIIDNQKEVEKIANMNINDFYLYIKKNYLKEKDLLVSSH